MRQTLPFNEHVQEYEEWFEKYPNVFESEVFGGLHSIQKVQQPLPGFGKGSFVVIRASKASHLQN